MVGVLTMASQGLTKPDKEKIRNASKAAIENYFGKRVANQNAIGWLDDANRYRQSIDGKYERDVKANRVHHRSVINYVAASSPAHVIDGWRFLSRAVDALIRNDRPTAIHLGYYAELRAAMSILASEGIGIANKKHPVIDSAGNTTAPMNGATHWKIWPVLNHWAGLKRGALAIDTLVRPNGIGLGTWIAQGRAPGPLSAVAQQWLRRWGVDLSNLKFDHRSRNVASYRPAAFIGSAPFVEPDVVRFVCDLWALFEPTPGGRFETIERQLLRKLFRVRNVTPSAYTLEHSMGLTTTEAADWAGFFNDPAELLPITYADGESPPSHQNCAFEVLSRASLLLFVATGLSRSVLAKAGYDKSSTAFFWKPCSQAALALGGQDLPEDPIDLWADIAEHMNSAAQWSTGRATESWRLQDPLAAAQISSFELAAVWGIAS